MANKDMRLATGANWGPLPSESEYSIFARVCVLNSIAISEVLYGWRSTAKGRKQEAKASSNSLSLTPYFVPDVHDAVITHLNPSRTEWDVSPEWFDTNLRACPECISSLYHCQWHQLKGLRACPVHGCTLISKCEKCGASLGPADVGLLTQPRSPYRCLKCRQWIVSKAPTVEAHLRLRERCSSLKGVLMPFNRWGYRQCELVVRDPPFRDQFLRSRRLKEWWSIAGIARGMAPFVHTYPPGYHEEDDDARMTWLCWPVSDWMVGTPRSQNRAIAYTSLLGQIKEWIMSVERHNGDGAHGEGTQPMPLFDSSGSLVQDGATPAALAYSLVRHVWEGLDYRSLYYDARIQQLRRPPDTMDQWHVRLTELSVQAIVLGQFAAFYWTIKRCPSPGRDDFVPPDRVIGRFQYKYTLPQVGNIVFPTIVGLPLGRFVNPQIRVEDGLALYRRWCRENRRSSPGFR